MQILIGSIDYNHACYCTYTPTRSQRITNPAEWLSGSCSAKTRLAHSYIFFFKKTVFAPTSLTVSSIFSLQEVEVHTHSKARGESQSRHALECQREEGPLCLKECSMRVRAVDSVQTRG
jgi:hypothetical protein